MNADFAHFFTAWLGDEPFGKRGGVKNDFHGDALRSARMALESSAPE